MSGLSLFIREGHEQWRYTHGIDLSDDDEYFDDIDIGEEDTLLQEIELLQEEMADIEAELKVLQMVRRRNA